LTKKKIFNIDNRPEEAARAIETLKGYPIQNKRLGVAYARTHDREALKDTNLVRVLELVERFTLD
jgi:RNA recognition motif-containing protein